MAALAGPVTNSLRTWCVFDSVLDKVMWLDRGLQRCWFDLWVRPLLAGLVWVFVYITC